MKSARVLLFCFYPWTFWRLGGWVSRWVADRVRPNAPHALRIALCTLIFVIAGLPLTIVLTAELVVQANLFLVGEFSDAYLRSDFDTGFEGPLPVPGAARATAARRDAVLISTTTGALPGRLDDPEHAWLVRRHAPVLIQRIGAHPIWDIPLHIDFDGNADPRDNVRNAAESTRFRPGIYGEVTAETASEYYLSYSVYHIRDYDHPMRALASAEAEHDNDNEGVMLRVTKSDMRVSEIMSWYHNRYFHCARRPESHGSERIMARAHFEDETHPILFVQAMGHGVRCAQSVDLEDMRALKVFRHRDGQPMTLPRLDATNEFDLRYDIDSFDRWYAQASGPFDATNMFEGQIEVGHTRSGRPIQVGRFIAGTYAGDDSWARPKPMWSWDDAWDELPIFVAHYFPSRAFRSHLGVETSNRYLNHRAAELSFGMSPEALWQALDLETDRSDEVKWSKSHFNEDARPLRKAHFYRAAKGLLKRYADYLFQALG